MPRIKRVDIGGYVYHVLNRANARAQIFDNDKDYELFEAILEKGKEKFDMRILAYSIMPNHWHLVLYPQKNGDLSKFMSWITNTHTKKWHSFKKTTGEGHLYQGRYKSFICQDDNYFITLMRYVERNPKKAKLVNRAEDWEWGSVWRRENGSSKQQELLAEWLVSEPEKYLTWLNESQTRHEEEVIENSISRDTPYGDDGWKNKIIKKFKLESTINPRGRPKNKKGD